ncbi:hypothetical protein [Pelomicrobium methylotrophicum]|uniref:Uncharacterized protein n=1 Tax=Pelomicrobium methylotrophicum TaxID=2602750 RepID=A0A5C7ESA9_9PROT|nr:hypothetical protein [Pelomicrobium methylotrophicum]TXF10700.1 hypothetical protein FR698_13765 [Pelomicrobium methylotrophicum]
MKTIGQRFLRFSVHLAISLAVFAVVMMGVGYLIYTHYERGVERSSFVQALARVERGSDPDALVRALAQGLGQASAEEAELTVFWLEQRVHQGSIPALYFMGLYAEKAGWRERALEFIAAAALVGRVDAARCGSPDAARTVEQLETRLGLAPAFDLLRHDPVQRARRVAWALAYEEKHRSRPRAAWICGEAAEDPAAEAAWPRRRGEVRTEFERRF